MSRVFKFRGWLVDSGNWNENDEPIPMMLYGDFLAFEEYMPINYLFLQIPMMQYAGLKDQNDVEIYEGDILRWSSRDSDGSIMEMFSEVIFQDGVFEVYNYKYKHSEQLKECLNYDSSFEKVELVGNIYENPELLETL